MGARSQQIAPILQLSGVCLLEQMQSTAGGEDRQTDGWIDRVSECRPHQVGMRVNSGVVPDQDLQAQMPGASPSHQQEMFFMS